MSGYDNSACSTRSQRSSRTTRCQDWVAGRSNDSGARRAGPERGSDRDYLPPTLAPVYESTHRDQVPPARSSLRRLGRDEPFCAQTSHSRRTLRPENSLTRLDLAQEGGSQVPSCHPRATRNSAGSQNREHTQPPSYRTQQSRHSVQGSDRPPSYRQSEYGNTRSTQGRMDRLAREARMARNADAQLVYSQNIQRTTLASGREVNTYEVAPMGAALRSGGGEQFYGNSQAGRRSRA